MKFVIQLIVILVLAFLLELFLPWWSIALAAFVGGALVNTKANFLAGFLAIVLLWLMAALMLESVAAAPLTDRVAAIFTLPKAGLFAVTAVIGGLVGGFAAMTGSSVRAEQRKRY